jgi:uroporphyrinogen-III synthase
MPDLPLTGRGIAVTRPAAQAKKIAALIRAQGGTPILFPLLEVAPMEDYSSFDQAAARLSRCDWAIFISANAVNFGVPRVLEQGAWPVGVRCAGIGPSTVTALAGFGLDQVLVPTQRFDSEGLLALPEMHAVAGKRVMIFRGVGGRELIAETLCARGAEVAYAECYRRRNPQTSLDELAHAWQNMELHAIIVTSSEALRNLFNLATDEAADWVRSVPVFANHPRIGELAAQRGLQAFVATDPGDEAMLQCLLSQATSEQTA